ncbi:MAG: XrtA system polysaccharide chain length determinant [Thiohalomonadales bacterium]
MPLQDIIQQFITYLRGMWRYRWYSMAAAWIIAIGGWVFIMQLDDEYSSSARVSVNTDSLLRPLLSGLALQSNVKQRVVLMTRRLLTRPILEKIIKETDLDLLVTDSASMNAMVAMLRKKIRIQSAKRSNIYTISVNFKDPKIAKNIVQTLVTIFVEETLGGSRTDSSSAQIFIENQIKLYGEKLRAAEERKREFAKKYAGKLTGVTGGYYQKLQVERSLYESALLELREVEFRRDELKSQMLGEEPVFGIFKNESEQQLYPHPLDDRIRQMQLDLNGLLLQYTEQHPQIISLKERIEDLTEKRVNDLATLPKRNNTRLDKNPVYQQMKIEYGRAEAEVSALKVRVQGYEKRVEKFQKLSDTVPEIEAKLNDLNRDYALNKRNYDTLISRLESAKLGQAAENTGDDIKFEVIDHARIALKPSGPKRALLSTAAIIGGLIFGLIIAFLMSQLRPVFYDQRTLRQVTGLPVFGSVTRIWTPQLLMKKRIEFGGFLSVGLVLGVLYLGVIFVGTSAPELQDQVRNTMRTISK